MPGSPLISVIIPVYDVADYLPDCLDSVLSSAAGDIEVIAVDDASPDRCGEILDDRAASDPRLRVVHLATNAGQGNARNVGLGLAAGEYVWFVDGDDRLADNAIETVAARLAEFGDPQPGPDAGRPDVLLIDWVSVYPGGQTEPSPGRDLLARLPAGGCTLADLPKLVDLTMTSWSKLLRREFLSKLGVSFAAGIHEDVLVTCAALLTAASIAATTRVCYCYRRDRGGSAMATTSTAHLAIFASYQRVFDLVAAQEAAGVVVSGPVRAAIFERAIWHYTTVLQSGGVRGESLVPRAQRREFFARMHADFIAHRPAGYHHPPGARGLKFALIERGSYPAYALAEPLNAARVAVTQAMSRRGAGRA